MIAFGILLLLSWSSYCQICSLSWLDMSPGDSALWPGLGLIGFWRDRSWLTVRPSCRSLGDLGRELPWLASVRGRLESHTARSWSWTGHWAKTLATIAVTTRMPRSSLTGPPPSVFMSLSGVSPTLTNLHMHTYACAVVRAHSVLPYPSPCSKCKIET